MIGDEPIEYVPWFQYLGRMLTKDDSDDMAAHARLEKARSCWGRFSHLLRADGASAETMGRFFRMVIQQTLLFGSETWVLSPATIHQLEQFQACCARGMAHRPIQRRPDGSWIHPPTDEVLSTICNLCGCTCNVGGLLCWSIMQKQIVFFIPNVCQLLWAMGPWLGGS